MVNVDLPMEVRRITANKNLKDDIGKVALQRGPLVYCAEWPDNNGKTSNIVMPAGTQFTNEFKPDLAEWCNDTESRSACCHHQ